MDSFLEIETEKYIIESKYFFVIEDEFPVSQGHCLIVSKKLRTDFFDLSNDERTELGEIIISTRNFIEKSQSPDGYNIGMNCQPAGGQTVMHFHCHVIPRYIGDMSDPRGGIRHCIPKKGNYCP
ncbi:MAG: HIT family protein [Planctomycetota bacterium]|nr:HIT family protein [Planctomycetota bacterium]